MQRRINCLFALFAMFASAFATAPVRAAAYGVEDNAQLFSADAISQANDLIKQIRSGDHRDVLVVTYPSIPADQKDALAAKGKTQFFSDWVADIGRENHVDGVAMLLTKIPGHLQIAVGNKTRQSVFTLADRDELDRKMLGYLREQKYDDALVNGLKFIKIKMDEHPGNAGVPYAAAPTNPGSSQPPYYSNPLPAMSHHFSVGGLLCVGIGILLIVFFVINAANRKRNYGPGPGANYGGGAPPPGGYPPGNYPPGNYGGGGYGYGGPSQGGGFGRGILGGLLGGALGAWGYDRFARPSAGNTNFPPNTGNTGGGDFNSGASNDQTDTNYSSTGGDFGPPDNSSSDPSSGGDFGSSDTSSGGDFGGGGGDSGGGGGGGDF